jgi:branched-chain amino acid transport system permease protein
MAMAAASRRTALRRPSTGLLLIVLLLVIACALPFVLDAGWLSTLVFILVTAIGALGLNVLTGYTGQVSLGHAFFLGVGAYTAAFLGDHGVNAAIWIPGAGVVAGVVGLVIGPTALRLRGLYLAIVTIGLVFVGTHLFVNIPSITGGPAGRSIPQPQWGPADFAGGGLTVLGVTIDRNGLYYFLALLLLVLAMIFVRNLMRSRAGRAMQAVRDREVAASLMGVNLARTKLTAFVVSSFLAGVCGAMYSAFLIHVDPDQWNLLFSIQFVAIIIVGGIGTVWGALLGSLFLGGLPSILERYSDSVPFIQHTAGGGGLGVTDATSLVYGVVIVVFLVVEPRGLIGLVARLINVFPQRRRPAAATITVSPVTEE